MRNSFLLCLVLFSCANKPNNQNQSNVLSLQNSSRLDSLQLLSLTKQIYKWHLDNNYVDFPYLYVNNSVFTGIDWKKHTARLESLKATNFFTDNFIRNYNKIAHTLDSSIKSANIQFRDTKNGIPIWSTNVDDWCNCQDYPANYWENISIHAIDIVNDKATYTWTWGDNSIQYTLEAIKDKEEWKINYMEGMKSYLTFTQYDSLLNK
ncbi:MAG: hypothetical protein O9294_00075 [Cytophagales bacterium]|nr:hypothetical protein [Cytophagales bacterium]